MIYVVSFIPNLYYQIVVFYNRLVVSITFYLLLYKESGVDIEGKSPKSTERPHHHQ